MVYSFVCSFLPVNQACTGNVINFSMTLPMTIKVIFKSELSNSGILDECLYYVGSVAGQMFAVK